MIETPAGGWARLYRMGLPHAGRARAATTPKGSTIFVLLHDLNRLARRLRLAAPERPGSLAARHVDAGSCNGCEHELTATAGPAYDLSRFGLSITSSPRHADVLLITGPITINMVDALLTTYDAMPEPRLVAALGDCALGCNVIASPDTIASRLEDLLPVAVRIPGCPPTPEQIIEGLRPLLDARSSISPK